MFERIYILCLITIFITSCYDSDRCDDIRNEQLHNLLQVTWFIEPIRSVENFGLVSGNKDMAFLKNKYNSKEIRGTYCLKNNTIIFKDENNIMWFTHEKFKIININQSELTLEFENQKLKTYYNPE